jgi:hypothetical protein
VPQRAWEQEAFAAVLARPKVAPLQKVTVKCPCGRRVSHTAVPEGTRAQPLRCDAECERQQRAGCLADAFGISDPAHHVPWLDRQRSATPYQEAASCVVQTLPGVSHHAATGGIHLCQGHRLY